MIPDRVKAPRVKPPRWLRPAILAIAALLLMGWFSAPAADSDTWWVLKTGQYIVQRHVLPAPDPFSFTTYLGKPAYPGEEATRDFNLKFEWLAEVILYLVYAAAGFPGLILLRAVMLSIFCATPGLIVFHRTRSLYRALPATLVTVILANVFVSDRPYQFTNLLLGVTLLILEFRRGLWLLPPVFWLWANCHGGYILGFVVLGAYLAESLVARWRGVRMRGTAPGQRLLGREQQLGREGQLWLVAAICLLVSGLNPNGFRGFTVLLAYRQSAMISALFEWQRPPLWPPTLVVLLLATAAVLLIWQRRKARVSDCLLLAGFGAAYATAVRNTPQAGLMVSWIIFSYIPSAKAAKGADSPASAWKPKTWPWPVVAEWVTAAFLLAGVFAELTRGTAFQFHETDWKYPSGAADFLLAHHVTAPMFNSWEKGGYLMWRLWPQERVFIDGRTLNDSVFRDYQRMIQYSPATGGPGGQELLDHYGIQVIVMNGFEANSGDPYRLPLLLADPGQSEWKLVYQDAQATVFMRQPPAGVPPLRSLDVLTSLEAQCGVILENDPDRPRCARGLGRLFARMGDLERARRWMGAYLERRKDRNPADDELYRRLGAAH